MAKSPKRITPDDERRPSGDYERLRARKPGRRRDVGRIDFCEAQLEAVIENMDEGIIVCDGAGRVLRMNRRAMEMHGYASAEETWRSLSEFADVFDFYSSEGDPIPPADGPLSRAVQGEAFADVRVRLRNKRTGAEWSARWRSKPIKDPQGNVAFAVLTLQEPGEPMEAAQRESESRLQSIFRAAPVGIGLVSNRVLLDVNDRLCEMTGYPREELVGHSARILSPTQEEGAYVGWEQYRQIGERGTDAVETRWRRKDGEVIDVLLSSTPLDPEDLSRGVTFTALDITERKKVENELRSIFTLSLDMICIADLRAGTLTKVNPAFQRTLGYSEQELLNRPFAEFVHPDDVDSTMAVLEDKLRRGERVFNFENRFRCKDGSYRWLNWTSHPRPRQGLTYAVARDITERKRMESALQESLEYEKVLGDMVRYASVAICIGFLDGRLGGCNPAFCELTGYTQEELKTISWKWDLTPPEWREQEAARLAELVRTKKAVRYEKECIRRDGSRVPIELVVHPEFDPEGRLRHCFAFITDITDRKQAETALRFTQFAVDHTADGAFWMTEDGRFCYVNEAACRALGYSREELQDLTVYDIDPLFTESMWADSWRALKAKKSIIFETLHRARDGRTYPVEIRANYVEFGGREYDCAFARDITERKRAEEALRESEARHRRLVENLKRSHFVYMHDVDGVFQYVSESVTDILGYAPDEFMTHYSTYLTDHPANQAVRRHTELSIQGVRQPPYEVNIRHKDGSTRWLEVQEVPVFDEGGAVIGVEGVAQDITERKQAEEALRESEERHRFLVESVNDWIWEVDENGVYTYASPQCGELLGYEPEEIVGKTPFDLMPPEEAERVREIFAAISGQRIPFRRLENVNRHKDGRLVVLETNGAPILDAHGNLAGYRGVDRDITERKQAEEALRESEERYRLLLDHGFDGIFVHENFQVVQLNDRFAEMTGYTRSELLGSNPIDLFTSDSQEHIRQYIHSGASGYYDVQLRHRDGHIVQVESYGAPCKFQGRNARIVALRDITERELAAEALREKEYLLSESQRIGHIGTWSVDLATNIATWTRETYRLFGVAPETFVPSEDTLLGLLHPDDRGAMREWIGAALAGEHPDFLEFRVALPDGSIRVLSGRGELILGDDNEPLRLVGTAQDVTEQKRAEASLRELSRKNEEALRVARMGHWEFDVSTGVFVFNDQYYTLHGTTALDVGGYRITAEAFARRYVHPDDAHLVQETIREAVAIEDPNFQFQTEARILRADGQVRWVTVWFRIEKDAQGRTSKLYGVNQDITERRSAEEALRRLNESLEQQVAQRTQDLTRTVARLQQLTWELSQAEDRERRRIADLLHDDVQQILAGARFHLNLLSIETRSADESREIIHQVRQMLKDAIEKARSLSHELSPALYQVDLTGILNWLGNHMQRKHGLVVHVKAHGQIEPSAEPLKALLYKVTQELLFNVVKHAGVNEVWVHVRRMGRCICLSVTDRGRGFDPRELEKTAGFGLLSIRERVHLLGGRMKIKSAPGVGSRFLIAVSDEGPSTTVETDSEEM